MNISNMNSMDRSLVGEMCVCVCEHVLHILVN